jgi:hypothetical protein
MMTMMAPRSASMAVKREDGVPVLEADISRVYPLAIALEPDRPRVLDPVAAVGYPSLETVARVSFGLFAVFVLFHASAEALGSDRGEAGLAVGAIVLAATIRSKGE